MRGDERSAVGYAEDVPGVFDFGRRVNFEYDALCFPRSERDPHQVARRYFETVRD